MSVITSVVNRQIVLNTFVLGILVGLIGTLLGFLLAYVQVKVAFKGKKVFHILCLLPVVSPPFAVATAVITLLGRRGIITNGLLGLETNIYGLPGLTLVLVLSFFPVAYMNFKGMLENLDPALDDASANLGASGWQTFFRITLPAIRWGLTYGIVLTVARSLGEFGAVIMVSSGFPGVSQTLTLLVHSRYIDDHNIHGAYSAATLLMFLAIVTLLLMSLLDRKRPATETATPGSAP